jgi:hypothetical protein
MDCSLLVDAVERTEPKILEQALANLASLAFGYNTIARAKAEAKEMEGEDE